MRAVYYCDVCLRGTRVKLSGAEEVVCRKCGTRKEMKVSESIREKNMLDVCAFCACGHFYVEKDFPAWIGAGIMMAGVIGFLVLAASHIPLALGLLLGLAAVDFVLYYVLPLRTNCYRCAAAYRGAVRNPEHGNYELGTAGRYTDDYEEQREKMKS